MPPPATTPPTSLRAVKPAAELLGVVQPARQPGGQGRGRRALLAHLVMSVLMMKHGASGRPRAAGACGGLGGPWEAATDTAAGLLQELVDALTKASQMNAKLVRESVELVAEGSGGRRPRCSTHHDFAQQLGVDLRRPS